MAVYVGLDLGCHTTRITVKDKGTTLCEPSVAAVDMSGNVVAVGTRAILVHSRAPGTVTLRRPLTNGTVSDFNLLAEMLDKFLEAAAPRQKKHVAAAVKYSLSPKDRLTLTSALSDCRTGSIRLVESATAALAGCGVDTEAENGQNIGTLLCDIGAGTVEASYIQNGDILRAESVIGGGDAADLEICAYIRRRYGVGITELQAKELKHSADLGAETASECSVTGVDTATGVPRRITAEIGERFISMCAAQTETAVRLVSGILANLPRQGSAESSADRIILIGGGAEMRGINNYIERSIGRAVRAVPEPETAVIRGLGAMLDRDPSAIFKSF